MAGADGLTGELLDRDLVERHDALMRRFAEGACAVCIALFEIRKGETYRARGFDSWKAFVKGATGLSETNARRYANCGPLLKALIERGHAELVRHPDVLRPISGMLSTRKPETNDWTVRRQLGIVLNAAQRSKRELVPFDEDLIADCARQVGWEPRGKPKKDKGPQTEEERRQQMRDDVELAIGVMVDFRLSGFQLEREIGLTKIPGFDMLREILNDAKDSAE